MSDPPFAVPVGMEWDPHKRRFFKAVPGKPAATARVEAEADKVKPGKRHGGLRTAAVNRPVRPNVPDALSLRLINRPRAGGHAQVLCGLRSDTPRLGAVQGSQRAVAAQQLSHARFTRTACAYRNDSLMASVNRRLVGIHGLCSSAVLGSLVHLMSWNGHVYLIDTSQMHPDTVTEVTLHLAELSWFAPRRPYQMQMPLSPNTLAFRASMADRLLLHTPVEIPDCYGLDEDCFVSFVSPLELEISRLSTHESSQQGGRSIIVQPEKVKVHIPRSWPRGGYVTLSLRRLVHENTATLCVGVGSNLFVFRVGMAQFSATDQPDKSKLSMRVDSDVIAQDISPSGRHMVVGCRNGRVLRLAIETAGDGAGASHKSPIKADEKDYLPVRGVGAVTNVKYFSEDEVVLAFSSGKLILLSLQQAITPLLEFEGHINSWTLNPAMAIDLPCRLFALAGQDRRVRIYTLDHAFPLSNSLANRAASTSANKAATDQEDQKTIDLSCDRPNGQRLNEVTFANEVTGLTFCQRCGVARDEGMQNATFLPRGVPALAVACGGSEIAFFE